MIDVVAVSGSLRKDRSRTSQILTPFLKGMKNAKARVELFYVKSLNIKPCEGDFYCWNRKLGECHIKDDMQTLYPKLRQADILVLATPVYVPFPGEMQNFINRLVPLINPILTRRDGRTRAQLNSNVKISKFVLVSTSGWWEIENFGTVVRIAKELAEDTGVEFAGALLRPHSGEMDKNPKKAGEVIHAAVQAGTELIVNGRISKDLLETISQPLSPQEP